MDRVATYGAHKVVWTRAVACMEHAGAGVLVVWVVMMWLWVLGCLWHVAIMWL